MLTDKTTGQNKWDIDHKNGKISLKILRKNPQSAWALVVSDDKQS